MHRLSIILLAGFFAINATAQSFMKIDSATYAQYLERDWPALIRNGRKALGQGVDYYYLRMRMGIAFYEQKNYRTASGHFRKALEFNNGDPVAQPGVASGGVGFSLTSCSGRLSPRNNGTTLSLGFRHWHCFLANAWSGCCAKSTVPRPPHGSAGREGLRWRGAWCWLPVLPCCRPSCPDRRLRHCH